MKNVKKIMVASLLGFAFSSVQAAETVIDFEDQQVMNLDVPLLTIGDVTFDAMGSALYTDNFVLGGGELDITNMHLTNGVTGFTALKMSFANSVSEFSFNLGHNQDLWELEAFDGAGTSLNSLAIPAVAFGGSNNGAFFGLSSATAEGIAYATLTNTSPVGGFGFTDNIMIDNFTYNTIDAVTPPPVEPPPVSAVPEPSTYALMLGGLGLVGFMAARRRKKA